MKKVPSALVFLAFVFAFSAHAYESDTTYGYTRSWDNGSQARKYIPTEQSAARLQKFNLALSTLGIPQEAAADFSDFPEAGTLSEDSITARLPLIDPDAGLKRYLSLSPTNISLFQDFFSAALPQTFLDYTLGLAGTSAPADSQPLLSHLNQIAAQVKDNAQAEPLKGLKILIDPGHMGSDFWDAATGKFVKVNGKKVSEGQINLWTSYLVANAFEELGATVILTRTQEGPVSQENYQNFVTAPYVNQYFYDSLDDWMAKYLKLSDAVLTKTLKQKPEVKKAYTSVQHEQFYISGADLDARSDLIDQEKPDIVFDIHFDANLSNQLQTSTNSLEAFVPGAFRADETGSRRLRSYALKHLLEERRWNASVDLANEVVTAMSASENVPLQNVSSFLTSVRVKDGVYARNLFITRRNLSALMVYLECLHYDHTTEFYKLANANEIGTYHGVNFAYPTRLKAVADGVKTGLLNYFKR